MIRKNMRSKQCFGQKNQWSKAKLVGEDTVCVCEGGGGSNSIGGHFRTLNLSAKEPHFQLRTLDSV